MLREEHSEECEKSFNSNILLLVQQKDSGYKETKVSHKSHSAYVENISYMILYEIIYLTKVTINNVKTSHISLIP